LAGGAAEVVTPRYDRARDVAAKGWTTTRGAFQPMVDQMRMGAANARAEYEQAHKKRNRWPALVGLLAAGAAVGATGAMIARRRKAAAEWEEYEPMPPMGESPYATERKSAAEKVTAGAASVAESVSAQAGKIAESLHGRSSGSSSSSSTPSGAGQSPETTPSTGSAAETSAGPAPASSAPSGASSPAAGMSESKSSPGARSSEKPSGSSNRRPS
jgi:cytoskeletal protein RodZ